MLRTTLASSRVLRVCVLGLATITTAIMFTSESADARRYKHRRHHVVARKLQPAVLLDHRRRQFRRGAHLEQSRRHPPSGFAHQDHDALSAVRAPRSRQDEARYRNGSVRARLRAGADQARPAARPDHQGRGRHQGPGDALRQRRRRRDRGSHCRRRRRFRQADDAQGARARHEQDHLSQRLRPAQRRTGHHRARSGDARPRDPGPLPALLSLLRDLRASPIAARRSAITTACSAMSKASTASRPATPAPPASIS